MADRLDPQERYERVHEGILALLALKDDDANAVMDPLFWTEVPPGRGEVALEGLREVAGFYAEEYGADVTCDDCGDPFEGPEETEAEPHPESAQTEKDRG